MKCLNKVLTIIGCITAAVAVVTAAYTYVSVHFRHSRAVELCAQFCEFLEAYLEGSIQ